MIATVLSDLVDNLHTVTFADEELLDCILAQEYATRLGSQHHAYPSVEDNVHPSAAYGELLTSFDRGGLTFLDPSKMVWSGDGGSVCMGYVYLNSAIVELFRRGLATQAIDEFLQFNRRGLAARHILGTSFAQIPPDFTAQAMQAEIDQLVCKDPAMKAYFFLLLNDQRRQLSAHFECIDMHRIELHLPLFDSDILELMVALPIEEGLYHRFYHQLMKHFSPIVRAVPWQAYPGHLPCPLPVPHGWIDQWQYSKRRRKYQAKARTNEASIIPKGRDLSRQVINKRRLCLAALSTRLGVADRSYLCKAAATVYRHWSICNASMQAFEN